MLFISLPPVPARGPTARIRSGMSSPLTVFFISFTTMFLFLSLVGIASTPGRIGSTSTMFSMLFTMVSMVRSRPRSRT